MKNSMNNAVREILKDGITPLTDPEFNSMVINRYLKEESKVHLKPSYNYSFLLYLLTAGILFISTIIGLDERSVSIININMPVEEIVRLLTLGFTVTAVYSLFVFISDIIEEKDEKHKQITHIAP